MQFMFDKELDRNDGVEKRAVITDAANAEASEAPKKVPRSPSIHPRSDQLNKSLRSDQQA